MALNRVSENPVLLGVWSTSSLPLWSEVLLPVIDPLENDYHLI